MILRKKMLQLKRKNPILSNNTLFILNFRNIDFNQYDNNEDLIKRDIKTAEKVNKNLESHNEVK